MKVIGISGSARENGSTYYLMREMLKAAHASGAETDIYNLAKMEIGSCFGCAECRKTGSCVRKDDMLILYDALKTADAIVIGTPVYMGEMSGQLKTFIDRCFALKDADRNSLIPPGKKTAVIVTQGAPVLHHYAEIPRRITSVFSGYGCVSVGTVTAAGVHNTDELLATNESVIWEAAEIGKRLL